MLYNLLVTVSTTGFIVGLFAVANGAHALAVVAAVIWLGAYALAETCVHRAEGVR